MKAPLPVLAFLLSSQLCFGWGNQGHKAIAIVAANLLNPAPRAQIKAILGNDDLSGIATWMDDSRNQIKHHVGVLKNDPESIAFNQQFPDSPSWHFVNLTVGTSAVYANDSPFASKDDIVHAISDAIDVLEGASTKYSKIQAMRVLVHMVGDIHQPMHCSSGYFDVTDPAQPKLITDAIQAVGKPNDRGGNQFFYSQSLELHALWDTKLVERIEKTPDPWLLSYSIKPDAIISHWKTSGNYHRWAAAWATDSLAQAAKAYEGIHFGNVTMNGDAIERIEITLPGGTQQYCDAQQALAKAQLAKAAVHLAQLLNGIKYK